MDNEPKRMDPRCDAGGPGYMLWMEYRDDGGYVRATDYDALAAKLADAERVARYESDIAQQALDQMKAEKARAKSAEAKLAEVTDDCDDLQIALASARKQLERYIGEAEAALPAVDPRIMEFLQHVADGSAKDYTNNHKWAKELIAAIRTLPTAAELMARINEGEK